MARKIRGIRDKIPGGYVLGRIGKGQGPVQLIKATFNAKSGVGGGSSGAAKTIAVEFYAASTMEANEVLGQIIAPVIFSLPTGLAGSYALASIASAGTVVLSIRKATAVGLGSVIGTITFTTSDIGVLSFAADVSFAIGDRLLVTCSATPDAALANTTMLLLGTL